MFLPTTLGFFANATLFDDIFDDEEIELLDDTLNNIGNSLISGAKDLVKSMKPKDTIISSIAAEYGDYVIYSDYTHTVTNSADNSYCNHNISGKIIKMKKDGTNAQVLLDVPTVQLAVNGDYLYYISEGYDVENGLYRYNLKNGKNEKISIDYNPFVYCDADSYCEKTNFAIYKDNVVYYGYKQGENDNEYGFFSYNISNRKTKKIVAVSDDSAMFQTEIGSDGNIYFWDDKTADIVCYNLEGKKVQKDYDSFSAILDELRASYIYSISDDYVSFKVNNELVGSGSGDSLCVIDLRSGEIFSADFESIGNVVVIGDRVYLCNYSSTENTEVQSQIYKLFDGEIVPVDAPDAAPTATEESVSGEIDSLEYLLFSELAYKGMSKYKGKDIAQYAEELYPNNDSDNNYYKNNTGKIQKSVLIQKHLKNWTVDKVQQNKESGFYVVVFRNTVTDDRVIAYRGSQSLNSMDALKTDWADNIQYGIFNEESQQMFDAVSFAGDYISSSGVDPSKISATGHSLGGGLGILAANMFNIYAETFDASQTIDVSYYRWNNGFVNAFKGVDKWTYVDHVNEYDLLVGNYEFGYKNAVKHKSTLNAETLFDNHKRDALLNIDEINQDVTLSELVNINDSTKMNGFHKNVSHHDLLVPDSIVFGAAVFVVPGGKAIGVLNAFGGFLTDYMLPKGSLTMGTSRKESLFGFLDDEREYLNKTIPHTDVIYGGDGDDTISPYIGDDYIVPGSGDDTIYEESGNDKYIYCKGQNTKTIFDSNGNDTIRLLGYTKDEIKNIKIDSNSDNEYIIVKDNEGTILKLWKTASFSTHSMDIVYNIDGEDSDITRIIDWGKVKNVRRIKIACPVDVKVYNASGELVTTLSDKNESQFINEDGVYSVIYDEKNNEYIKYVQSVNTDYTYEIVGLSNGSMSISESFEKDDGTLVDYSANEVAVTGNTKLSLSSDENGQLSATDGTRNIEFVKNEYLPVSSIEMNKESLSLNLKSKEYQLSAKVEPENSTTTAAEWESTDENVATVDQSGKVTVKGVGEAIITAEIDGKVTACTVTVHKFNALLIIVPSILILASAAVLLIIVLKKKKAKKTETKQIQEENIISQIPVTTAAGVKIRVMNGVMADAEFELPANTELIIGKSQTADISLGKSYSKVSNSHCKLYYNAENSELSITDMSSNGTYIQDIKLPQGETVSVELGAVLTLADTDCQILVE